MLCQSKLKLFQNIIEKNFQLKQGIHVPHLLLSGCFSNSVSNNVNSWNKSYSISYYLYHIKSEINNQSNKRMNNFGE